MTQLQTGLLTIGLVVLALVGIYQYWIFYRNTPKKAKPLPKSAASARSGSAESHASASAGSSHAVDATPASIEPSLDDAALISKTAVKREPLNEQIDVLAQIDVNAPVSAEQAMTILPSTRRVGTKPFAIEGRHAESGAWEPLQAGARYSAFRSGIQLANRMGALNAIEFSEFVVKTQAFADGVHGLPHFPDMLEEVARARELDQFAAEHDAQLGLTVRTRGVAWNPSYVQQHAAQVGFVPGMIPGRMVIAADVPGAPPVVSLTFDTQAALTDTPEQAALREFHLSLDVPQVAQSEQGFARMRDAAMALARAMNGLICDDAGKPLAFENFAAIESDLNALYQTLAERDLPAGSVQARRLFS